MASKSNEAGGGPADASSMKNPLLQSGQVVASDKAGELGDLKEISSNDHVLRAIYTIERTYLRKLARRRGKVRLAGPGRAPTARPNIFRVGPSNRRAIARPCCRACRCRRRDDTPLATARTATGVALATPPQEEAAAAPKAGSAVSTGRSRFERAPRSGGGGVVEAGRSKFGGGGKPRV